MTQQDWQQTTVDRVGEAVKALRGTVQDSLTWSRSGSMPTVDAPMPA